MKTSMRTAALATALSRAQASLDGVAIGTPPSQELTARANATRSNWGVM